ncbi:MAG TPA: uracil-DNA glycosylase [Candidatus Peribacteria bacterium]|nr:uracil-DNA glycosylase [Candidatus Peribacteria bacterium]
MELTLDLLREKLSAWKGCELAKNANPVLGEGNPHATVMFIGEAPGQKEDELKRPFVGASGNFLNELLGTIGLKREDVYISNVVKYRPPENRDPTPEEKEQCMPWLMMEIGIIKPRVICTLGRHSMAHFIANKTITQAHGKPFKLSDALTVFPIYHPAAALHNGNLRESLYSDFRALGEYLKSQGIVPTPAPSGTMPA